MNDTRTPIATLLREARLAADLSQQRLSKLTGVDQTKISAAETDRLPPYPAMLDAYIDALALDRDEVYSAAGRVPPEIVTALAADLPLVRRIRKELGL